MIVMAPGLALTASEKQPLPMLALVGPAYTRLKPYSALSEATVAAAWA